MDSEQPSDERLMRQVALGEREHVRPLLQRWAGPLLTFIARTIGDRHRSEELFQDVFLAVWQNRRKYEYPRPFRSWLFGIAMNKCRADLRRTSVVSIGPDEPAVASIESADPSPLERVVASETSSLVVAAVAELPTGQRTTIVLRVFNGLPYAEIAEILECKEATVRSHMCHGLAAIRKYLEPRL
ncbi:unnamed protein product [marine sediment metagenome]|uniref:HTH luxR-type domain-containing protein n=1 Tax=marine sediment metagenome TaxID=412755 RepID=X0RIB6_9ZZZZ